MARPMRPEDLYRLRSVADCDLHPDGVRVVYAVSWADEATDANRFRLWLHDGAAARPLTEVHAASAPRFSPDGRWLAYLSAGAGARPQLALASLEGGEPVTLTDLDDGVGDPVWLEDSSGVVVTAPTRPPDQRGVPEEELARRPRRIDTTWYRFNGRGWIHDRRRHVFVVPVPAPGESPAPPRQLTEGPWDDAAPAPDPSGRWVAFTSARHDDREWAGGNDVWVVPLEGGEARRVTEGGSWSYLRWLPGGDALVAVGQVQRGEVRLASPHVLLVDGEAPPRLLGDGEVACGGLLYGTGPHRSVVGEHIYLLGVRRGAVHVDRYHLGTGAREAVVGGRRAVGSFALSADGLRIVFTATGENTPAELHELRHGFERKLTSVAAPFLDEIELAPVREVDLRAADGAAVHAFVCEPPPGVPGAGPDGRPGLVYVHGGPLAQYGWGFFDEFQLAAAAGYVVMGGNPRGSDGYGLAHAAAIAGDLGGRDWLDVQAVADALSGRFDVDSTRIGIGGGSYGGFMVGWAIGHTDRFRAALSERAVNNWVTMEATSDIGWFVALTCGATTFDGVESLRRQSPITYAPAMRTPTLIIHSENDHRCPPEQAEQLFAALRRAGVETVLVRFPGEDHELTRSGRPAARVERLRIVHEWWARHLGGHRFGPLDSASPSAGVPSADPHGAITAPAR